MTDIRCGDHVLHEPSGETWVVAYVRGDRLAWCGWPEGETTLAKCRLIKACTDEENADLLYEIAHSQNSTRTAMAKADFAALPKAVCVAAIGRASIKRYPVITGALRKSEMQEPTR